MNNADKSRIQKQIVDSLNPKPVGRLLLAPRVGKTKIGIDIIKKNKYKSILWVTPSSKLADIEIPKEFITWKAKLYLKKLTTVTWSSLNKIKGHFDIIILDEEQFMTENNAKTLLNKDLTGNIITMTGTPTKHEDKLDLYEKLELKVLYKITINQAVNMDLLSNYSINVLEVDLRTTKDLEAGNAKKRFMTSEKLNYEWLNRSTVQSIYQQRGDAPFKILARRRAILNSSSKSEATRYLIDEVKGRKLTFAGTIRQAEELCKYTYHSKTDGTYLRQFQSGEIDEIAMVNAGGVGETYKAIDHLIMVQADSDKNGLTSQKICRTLLQQKGYKATIWIICLLGTQDEKWVGSALENFDKSKVKYIKFKNFKI